jgi:hypothetical protein
MPAIQPARLKKQAVDLAAKFNQPASFIRDLRTLLDLYTDHTHRSGHVGEPSSLIGSYMAPAPVVRQVWNELIRQLKSNPESILPLCDALWVEPNYDLQLLAARLLGLIPIESPEPLIDRLHLWVCSGLDKRLLDGLLEYGMMQFHQNAPGQVLELISSWLTTSDHSLQHAGMRALLPLIADSGTENLPAVFRLLTPFTRIAPSNLRPDILAVLSALAHSSPNETAYFLRQSLASPDNPDTPWLIRQVLSEFPPETQMGLRMAIKRTL